jgi:hemolysin III
MVRVNQTSIIEEIFNAITHGVGVILGIIGLIFLLNLSIKSGNVLKNISYGVFGAAVTIAYLSSTLYHSLTFTKARKVFKILDHSSIFLLIAGTYTPFTLLALKGEHGMGIFLLIWIFAILGIVLKAIWVHRFMKFSLALYLFMGWMIVFEIKPLLKVLPIEAVFLLGIGGLFYTLGITFYLFKKLPFHHAIWHIFVLCGSIAHFFALFYL